jgi:hypothetical protein
MSSTKKQQAMGYVQRGWAVFPLIPNGKTPLTKNGFKDASKDSQVVSLWWDQNPEANIGIATGTVSGLVVLDLDEKHGGYETLEELNEQGFSVGNTLTAQTGGGGLHFYFRHPGFNVKNKAGLFPGLDIRGDGGYVVAPGSIHESGHSYEWLETDLAPIENLPGWLKEKMSVSPPPSSTFQQTKPVMNAGEKGELSKATLKFIASGAEPGTWHHNFYKSAIDLKQNNYEFEEAEELLSKATGHLDETDLAQLLDVYENREPKHPPRLSNTNSDETDSLVVSASSLIDSMVSFISDKAKVKGLATGFDGLDKMLGGGKRLGEVTCWHAEAKTGKNTVWHNLMYYWLEAGIPIGYASRELTPETEVLPDLMSIKFLENSRLVEVTPQRIAEYKTVLERWPLYFASGYGYFDLSEIKKWVQELRARGVEYFWFDHLHYMLEDPEDHKAASKLIKELKTLAKQENIHIDIIIQPNKLMDGQRLSLNSIKGGAAMGQAIDNLLLFERVKIEGVKDVSKLTLAVARSKLCRTGHIYFQYDKETTTLQETEIDDSSPVSVPEPDKPAYRVATVWDSASFRLAD